MASSAALLVSLVVPAPPALRFLLAVLFVAFGPGTAILAVLGARSPVRFELGLIVALGMAATALISELMIAIGAFYPHPEVAMAAAAVFIIVAMTYWRSSTMGTGSSAPTDVIGEG
jgi:hypothetical protein